MILYRYGNPGDTLKFAPEQKREISISTSDKGTDDDPDCVFDIDSAWVHMEDGGKFTKKIQDSNNWISETDQVKHIPPQYENTCVFEINASDFEWVPALN